MHSVGPSQAFGGHPITWRYVRGAVLFNIAGRQVVADLEWLPPEQQRVWRAEDGHQGTWHAMPFTVRLSVSSTPHCALSSAKCHKDC